VREEPPAWVASRGAQQAEDPATDQRQAKRDGRGAEAQPIRASRHHGEARAQEGQVGRWLLIVAQ
jgi:hypothetical protein